MKGLLCSIRFVHSNDIEELHLDGLLSVKYDCGLASLWYSVMLRPHHTRCLNLPTMDNWKVWDHFITNVISGDHKTGIIVGTSHNSVTRDIFP